MMHKIRSAIAKSDNRYILQNTVEVDEVFLITTDGYKTYKALAKEFDKIIADKIPSNQAHIKLPWVNTAIGNAKKVLQGIFHRVNPEYLQNYLDEFCYKLNRKYFGLNIID